MRPLVPEFTADRASPGLRVGLAASLLVLHLLTPDTGTSQVLPVRNYSVADGLLANDIEAISQDSRGYMWFGTSDGISVFDGNAVTHYTTRDGLHANFIRQIVPDARDPGIMWVLSGGHLNRFSNSRFSVRKLPLGGIVSLYRDRLGRIWCLTTLGPVVLDGDSVLTPDIPPLRDGCKEMAEGRGDVLWFAKDSSVIRYSPGEGTWREIPLAGVTPGWFRSMAADPAGDLWVCYAAGFIIRIRDTAIIGVRPGLLAGTTGEHPEVIHSVAGDRIWCYGYDGFTVLPKDRFETAAPIRYTTENGLLENTLRSSFTDREGNLWIGGRDRGVMKVSEWNILRFPIGSVWFVHHTQFAFSDSNDHIWAIAQERLTEFWRDRDGAWHTFAHDLRWPDSLVLADRSGSRLFSALACDARGRLWISSLRCPGLIDCYDIVPDGSAAGDRPSSLKLVHRVRVENELSRPWSRILIFTVSANGELWAFGPGLGLARYRPGLPDPLIRLYGEADGVPINYLRCFYQSRSGDIWAGSYSDGLLRISPDGGFQRYTSADGLPDNAIWTIGEDHAGRILLGTSNEGLVFLEADSTPRFRKQAGVPSHKVFTVTEDPFQRLWLGTSMGMVYSDSGGSESFIAKQEFIGASALASGVTRSGLVWFVTPDELVVYDYVRDVPELSVPLIQITSLRVNGIDVPVGPELRLPSGQNNLEIGYAGISFRDERAVRYLNRLVGADERWNGPTRTRSITYGHLDPGSYRFEVSAISVSGVRSASPALLSLVIDRPFWQGGWFIGGAVSAIVLAVWSAYRVKTGRMLRDQRATAEFSRRLINSQEAERKRVAGELHDGVGQYFLVILSRAKMALREVGQGTAAGDLEEIVSTAGQGIEDVRKAAFALSPYDIEQFGLPSSIETMLKRLTPGTGLRWDARLEALRRQIPRGMSIHIYRTIQECATNVVKHAEATEMTIDAAVDGEMITLTIRDNGRGFQGGISQAGAVYRQGFGLAGLRERIRLLGGSLRIDSPDGGGTTVVVTIPLRVANSDENHQPKGGG